MSECFIGYKGENWECVFLYKPGLSSLKKEDYQRIGEAMQEMHTGRTRKLTVESDTFEGTVYTHGERSFMGPFCGQQFHCEYENNGEKGYLSFLAHFIGGADDLLPEGSRN